MMRRRGLGPLDVDPKPANVAEVDVRDERLPPPSPRPQPEGTVTVIGNGARLEGTLISAASLRIEGTVKGQIEAEGDVVLAPDAEVAADIRATNVVIGSGYTGNVTAAGTLELTGTARVQGNITCRTLIVNQGAVFSGQSVMETGGPAKPESSPPRPARLPAPAAEEKPPAP